MTNQLSLYNGALRMVGERRLGSLSENREPRRLLDEIWDDGAQRFCLEQGMWAFAKRSIQLDYSPSVEPPFGYLRAFDLPTDFVRTISLCSDPYFQCPLLQYSQEAGFWFADLDTIYVQYVSDDLAYGLDMSLWPETFVQFFSAYLARELGPRLKNGSDQQKLEAQYKTTLTEARSKDAMESPTKFLPSGSWVNSRSRGTYRKERGIY